MCFLFFKQETAYELRISDWSSDVCSSDLCGAHRVSKCREQQGLYHDHLLTIAVPRLSFNRYRRLAFSNFAISVARSTAGRHFRSIGDHEDRKSVVSGKRVAVRVDLGGRRHLKKNKKIKNIIIKYT